MIKPHRAVAIAAVTAMSLTSCVTLAPSSSNAADVRGSDNNHATAVTALNHTDTEAPTEEEDEWVDNWREAFSEDESEDMSFLEESEIDPESNPNFVSPEDFFMDPDIPIPFVEADSWEQAEEIIDEYLEVAEESTENEIIHPAVVAQKAGIKYGPCWLKPKKTWLRKSGGYGVVGTKPTTDCTKEVSQIKHSTQFYYKRALWMVKAGGVMNAYGKDKTMTQKNAEFSCKGTKKKWWTGETKGTVTYNGKRYYATVRSTLEKLACNA